MTQLTAAAPATATREIRIGRITKATLLYILLLVVAIFSIGPFLWEFSTSLKSVNEDLFSYPPSLLPQQATTENYIRVFDFITWGNIWNSVFISVVGTLLNLLFSALAAYPLARYEFPGKRILMGLLLTVLLLPLYTTLVVNFKTLKAINLQNTLAGVILPTAVTVFGIFLLRQGYITVPKELEDAGRVDGANEFRIWWRLMLPLIGPSLATLAVFSFVENWNSFLWPLIILSDQDKYPLTLALQQAANAVMGQDPRVVAAGTILSILPILVIFMFSQRYFISGVAAGSVKG